MATNNSLTEQEILELKNSIDDLESSIEKIYSHRKIRNLLGKDGILVRTLGSNYNGPEQYEAKYFDKKRKKFVDTEFSEVINALGIYDNTISKENEIDLLLEVGDILVQKKIIDLNHKNHRNYASVNEKFDSALEYIANELEKRDISFDNVEKLAEIKYGAIAWLCTKGYNPKDENLQRQLCIEAYYAITISKSTNP